MKNNFVLLAIVILGLISIVSAFESESYNLSTSVSSNGINFTIDNSISVNVTNDSTTTSTEGETTNGGATGGGGGGSLLSSVIKSVFNDEENVTENSETEGENPEETTTSTNFLTGFAVGFSDFAQSPAGVATFITVGLMIVGGITFLAIKGKFKNFLPKKNVTVENNNS